MYLVSLYFDDKTARKIQGLINKVSVVSGNDFMTNNNVPPHITIAAFQSDEEDKVIELLDKRIKDIDRGEIIWASIGVFKSSVIFLAPVLNEYLHNLSVNIYEGISSVENISISKFYLPFNWMPHTTIGKKLTKEELMLAFQELEKNFTTLSGLVTKIALSKTNPYEDIIVWHLDKK
ncbi:2'-5' RNA ligase family protein [Clostridium paraputrificum]|uniref:2'-5' RNA ligase family protein n=1 Tax=Clostridium paraputrificum TaxID=29363 RepID=UPI003D342D22